MWACACMCAHVWLCVCAHAYRRPQAHSGAGTPGWGSLSLPLSPVPALHLLGHHSRRSWTLWFPGVLGTAGPGCLAPHTSGAPAQPCCVCQAPASLPSLLPRTALSGGQGGDREGLPVLGMDRRSPEVGDLPGLLAVRPPGSCSTHTPVLAEADGETLDASKVGSGWGGGAAAGVRGPASQDLLEQGDSQTMVGPETGAHGGRGWGGGSGTGIGPGAARAVSPVLPHPAGHTCPWAETLPRPRGAPRKDKRVRKASQLLQVSVSHPCHTPGA